jgi:hypothetical protein
MGLFRYGNAEEARTTGPSGSFEITLGIMTWSLGWRGGTQRIKLEKIAGHDRAKTGVVVLDRLVRGCGDDLLERQAIAAGEVGKIVDAGDAALHADLGAVELEQSSVRAPAGP